MEAPLGRAGVERSQDWAEAGRLALAVASDGVIHYSSFPVGRNASRMLVRGRLVHGPLPESLDRVRAVRSGLPSDVRRGIHS